ncbi:unnamed protein product [Paramecium pentaurelia]|uniref:Uncharacterized protein n=1 Tax=Paramecium pentaurelia TaxID=43138 RepID=A0A8S1Y0Q8_9CILI|nr:unnamed protein product [Paramecium pentaurelia]
MQNNNLEQSFANYVNKLNSYSVLKINQDSQNKFGSSNLPKLIVPTPFESNEMLNYLERAKFPKKTDLNKTIWIEFKQEGTKSFNKLTNELFQQLEPKSVKLNTTVQRLNFRKFQLKIPKSQQQLMRSRQKYLDQLLIGQQRIIKTEF